MVEKKTNGEDPKAVVLGLEEKIGVIFTAVSDMFEAINELREQQAEIIEKLDNLSLPGVDFGIFGDN